MLQKTFNIRHDSPANQLLNIELGSGHLVLSSFDEMGIPCKNFTFYSSTQREDFLIQFEEIMSDENFFPNQYKEVKVIWENEFATCIPQKFFSEQFADVYKEQFGTTLGSKSLLYGKTPDMTVPFLADADIMYRLNNYFPTIKHSHKYLEIINNFENYISEQPLNILSIFYQNHFIITVTLEGKFQMINSFAITNETEVVYHLLNIAKQYHTDIQNTRVILGGLIDGDSRLFKEIYKYIPIFDVDSFEKAGFLQQGFSEHPSHFFVPFFKYA